MCKNTKCRAPWCMRLEHWIEDFRAKDHRCPKGCVVQTTERTTEPSQVEDNRCAAGLGCQKCGTYFVPDIPADIAREMYAERLANKSKRAMPPGWVEREFQQNAQHLNIASAA